MRTREEIEARIRTLLAEELERRWAALGERLPTRCFYNTRHNLDTRRRVSGDTNPEYNRIGIDPNQDIGLCLFGAEDPTEWPGTICEDAIDAARCPNFLPKMSRDAALSEFEEQIRSLEWLQVSMPEVRGLLWVLDGVPKDIRPPWWRRLLWAALRRRPVSVPPPLGPFDVTKLLPAHGDYDGIHDS